MNAFNRLKNKKWTPGKVNGKSMKNKELRLIQVHFGEMLL